MSGYLRVVAILLISLMLIPAVSSVAASGLNKVVIVGSIDPSLGYDEIVNGTTTFHVARTRPVSERTFYHNVTKFEWKHSSVEVPPETPGSYCDNLTGKYYCDTLVAEPYELTVPDPSGKVTVFSNMVFQGTGWNPKSKRILHPDGTSQSILHVKGQASGDSYPRYLVVTIYNSKYPSGYQVDYTVVQSSFDKSYDVTNIIAEREVNNISIVVTTYVGKWDVQSYFWVSTVGTDVYIIMIPDVPTHWVSDIEAVRRGVETACMVTPLVHLDTWKGLTYLEVIDMSTYQYIIEYPENVRPPGFYGETGIIVVNAHGEVFPVPSGVSWDSWVDTISLATQTNGLTWVQVAGYPFYYYSQGSNTKTEVGGSGFQRFLQRILGPNSIDCWPNQEGYAVPLQGGYSNRLWGYGLIDGGLHEGRPLKIDSSTNLADLLGVMGYKSADIKYLTLGLIGFAFPNQDVQTPSQRAGYYVHNGAIWYDADYNKGKYSMATAAWVKISLLSVTYVDVPRAIWPYDYWGFLKCEVAWSYAVPPAGSTDPWKIVFVTTTIAAMRVYQYVITAMAPLKVTSSTSTTSFQFVSSQSTTLYDLSQDSWQSTIGQGFFWTAVSVALIQFTAGWSIGAQIALAVGLGFTETVIALAFESPSPVTSGSYIDLALEDKSQVCIYDSNGKDYMQVSSYGVTEAFVAQSPNGGASETFSFTLGQKGLWYYIGAQKEWLFNKILTFDVPITVEPYMSGDSNESPQTPQTPVGSNSGYVYTSYVYSTSTTDPKGDDVRYIFYWGDGSNTVTNWYESGNTVSASHQWSKPGTYYVQVQAQDCQGAYTALSSSLTVTITQNDAGTGGDAGDSFSTATLIGTGSRQGTLYQSNPTDTNDYYKFYAASGQYIYVSMTPPSGVDFDLQLYDPNGYLKAGSYLGAGYTDSVSYTADSSGYWRARIYIWSGEGQYSFYVSVYTPGGGGGCPTLFIWNGTSYVEEGVLDIHAESDVTVQHEIQNSLVLENGVYKLQLRELDEFTSHIDQVKLYAVDYKGKWNICPLTYAYHNELGKVKQTLLLDDSNRVDLEPTETIDLKFAPSIPYSQTAHFIFEINGYNMKVP